MQLLFCFLVRVCARVRERERVECKTMVTAA